MRTSIVRFYIPFEQIVMRITYRTLFILLLVTVLIMAYCSTTADAKSVKQILNRHRQPARRPVVTKYKIRRKTKIRTTIRRGHKKPSVFKKIKNAVRRRP